LASDYSVVNIEMSSTRIQLFTQDASIYLVEIVGLIGRAKI